jgi:hypothetical protein
LLGQAAHRFTSMSASLIVSAIALVVSMIVFVDNRVRQMHAARLARRPVLVFAWDHDEQHWELCNIGLGPALDVVSVQKIRGEWTHPLRLPELAAGGSTVVPWRWIERWDPDPGLGARYRSVTDEAYSTITGNDRSHVTDTWAPFPDELWSEIEPHWSYQHERPRSE